MEFQICCAERRLSWDEGGLTMTEANPTENNDKDDKR